MLFYKLHGLDREFLTLNNIIKRLHMRNFVQFFVNLNFRQVSVLLGLTLFLSSAAIADKFDIQRLSFDRELSLSSVAPSPGDAAGAAGAAGTGAGGGVDSTVAGEEWTVWLPVTSPTTIG